jgi:hypothetical protein
VSDGTPVFIRGTAAGMTFDFEARIVGISDQEAFFVTKSELEHHARVRVRHQGSVLGGRPYTTCTFEWDGAYISFANYLVADDGAILVQPEDP